MGSDGVIYKREPLLTPKLPREAFLKDGDSVQVKQKPCSYEPIDWLHTRKTCTGSETIRRQGSEIEKIVEQAVAPVIKYRYEGIADLAERDEAHQIASERYAVKVAICLPGGR